MNREQKTKSEVCEHGNGEVAENENSEGLGTFLSIL